MFSFILIAEKYSKYQNKGTVVVYYLTVYIGVSCYLIFLWKVGVIPYLYNVT